MIDHRSETWKQVAALHREQMTKAIRTLLSLSADWTAVQIARQQYRDALKILKLDPEFKTPEWSANDD